MTFIAVQCRCGNIWAADGGSETSRCSGCGLRLVIAKANVHWRGTDARMAGQVVAELRQRHLEETAPAWAR